MTHDDHATPAAEAPSRGWLQPWLERVRLLLQRYVLQLDPILTPTPAGEPPAVLRTLLGLAPPAPHREQLARIEAALDADEGAEREAADRFAEVRHVFALSRFEVDLLWVSLATALDPAMLWLMRALWKDPDAAAPTPIFLAHVVDPQGHHTVEVRRALSARGALLRRRLLVPLHEGANAPLHPAPWLVDALIDEAGGWSAAPGHATRVPAPSNDALPAEQLGALARGFRRGRCFVLESADRREALRVAAIACAQADRALVEHAPGAPPSGAALLDALTFAAIQRAALLLSADEAPSGDRCQLDPQATQLLLDAACPVFIHVARPLDAQTLLRLAARVELTHLRLDLPDPDARRQLWREALTPDLDGDTLERLTHVAAGYSLGAAGIAQAVALARVRAGRSRLRPAEVEDACRLLAEQRLGALAHRVTTQGTWSDVVLNDAALATIREIVRFGRHRKRVFEELGYGATVGYGRALTALFWGPPGTGKTMISGLIARELGVELYRIDLSRIVSKYIGETEQQLALLFREARQRGVGLLFDEADSLFARRSEVKSSNDRYANLEVNFLLQAVEAHEGLVILTTNRLDNLDEAFMRRIQFRAQLPMPDCDERARIWRVLVPATAPQRRDLDLRALAERYELAGGDIRKAVLRAAFEAVEHNAPLAHEHLAHAAEAIYRESGRLLPAR